MQEVDFAIAGLDGGDWQTIQIDVIHLRVALAIGFLKQVAAAIVLADSSRRDRANF